jgi:hypothetical protein
MGLFPVERLFSQMLRESCLKPNNRGWKAVRRLCEAKNAVEEPKLRLLSPARTTTKALTVAAGASGLGEEPSLTAFKDRV